MDTKFCVNIYRIQSKRVRLQHVQLPLLGLPILQEPPALPALHIAESPAGEVCGRVCLVGTPSSPKTPDKDTKWHSKSELTVLQIGITQ